MPLYYDTSIGGIFMSKLKRTTEEVKQYFKEQGCELLGEYLGAQIKMKYRCSCDNISEINWNHFTQGKRCGLCKKHGQKKKRNLKEVQQIFKDRDCEFLDKEFKGVNHKHNYRCKCNRLAQISFIGFFHQNQNCYRCGIEKNSGPNHARWNGNRGSDHPRWIPDREEARLRKLFRKRCYKAVRATLLATGKEKVGKTTALLGYTPKQLQDHIISHPNWNLVKNENWHIDHIFPLIAFIEHGINDIALINCLDNLRPISQVENNHKWATYDKKEFKQWLITKK